MSETARFKTRWRITGTLTTTAPLHIGDGASCEKRIGPTHDGAKREVQTICRGADGAPFIPASSLKGPLRAWLSKRDAALAERLFGALDDKDKSKSGGAGIVAVWDARMKTAPTPGTPPLPHWDAAKSTAVSVSVSIDRRTRTALEHHLFHVEYIPAGAVFAVELTAQTGDEGDIAALLGALEQFGKDDALTLGAHQESSPRLQSADRPEREQPITLGAHQVHGWGRVAWSATKVFVCEKTDVEKWLKDPTTAGFGVATREKDIAPKTPDGSAAETRTIAIELSFSSPLLVRDPQQKERVAEAKRNNVPPEKRPKDATPLLAADGKPLIPARAARGVLRSRAEMILRTIGKEVPPQPPSVSTLEDVQKSDLATRLFGASGWRAPLTVSDFTLAENCEDGRLTQEFIAIDRFTGGGAEGLKFNSIAATGKNGAPLKFQGTLTLDLARLVAKDDKTAPRDEALAILALVLRDLCEGDLTFGSGASKGYGTCTATIDGTAFATWATKQTINLATLHA